VKVSILSLLLPPTISHLQGDYGIELDYHADVFLSMFSSSPQKSMRIDENSRIVYGRTGKAPPIVHYNGGATCDKEWMHGYCDMELSAMLEKRAAAGALGTQPVTEKDVQARFEQLFTFLGPRFERLPTPDYARDIRCSRGAGKG
jgi:hypothetical protein